MVYIPAAILSRSIVDSMSDKVFSISGKEILDAAGACFVASDMEDKLHEVFPHATLECETL